ncbi:citrate lyase acyl carrier protein [Desulfosporosinus acidiphilus SJ4]|uniref:Citrate lyase acyl carrier protein n=1 Tax=Desulfosporosinus acidiphilus (strain DSM 22704 / JCM 16185 / SJ4) TaxID=646529 RepID=I4D1R1_DESAJ|nr:citrate lyase acyl carrier protein [Desulfosporosinus acidiphilus]AFM39735.1 citrate lyase acyl carrier protein [Desulfosporosinus acidiphilus SJ4]
MKINKTAQAGAIESSDVLVTVAPNPEGGIKVELETKRVIQKQFGKQIEKVILETVKQKGIDNALIKAQDKGALDYTYRARVLTALERASI